jgi:hypothetical protein
MYTTATLLFFTYYIPLWVFMVLLSDHMLYRLHYYLLWENLCPHITVTGAASVASGRMLSGAWRESEKRESTRQPPVSDHTSHPSALM